MVKQSFIRLIWLTISALAILTYSGEPERLMIVIMKELLEFIAKSLVEKPDDVNVTQTENDTSIVLELRVADGDMGKVIGRQGKIAKAVRTVIRAASVKEKKKVIVDIV